MTREADVVVVGGGPAGSVTARLLAGEGHEVLLLDRYSFPRPKPCGESLNPGAVRELDELGLLEHVRRLPHERIRGWRVHPVGSAAFEGTYPHGGYGIAVDRTELDFTLLGLAREAGVRVRSGTKVTDLLREGARVDGVVTASGEEIRAKLVVGADGLRSVVARRLGAVRRPPRLRKVALTAHVSGALLPPETGILRIFEGGCLGIVAIGPATANVVVVLEGAARTRIAGRPDVAFDRVITGSPYLRGARRIGAVLATGPFDRPMRSLVTDGALLVGDAAGYFDPLTGQGIYRALRGGRTAARVAGPLLAAGRPRREALLPYERRHRKEFGAGERVQRLIEIGVEHPFGFSAAAALLRRRPRLADAVLAVTGDLMPISRALRSGWERVPHPARRS